jgi:hypothetical protein
VEGRIGAGQMARRPHGIAFPGLPHILTCPRGIRPVKSCRPYEEGAPQHPDGAYTVESVGIVLSGLLKQLASGQG